MGWPVTGSNANSGLIWGGAPWRRVPGVAVGASKGADMDDSAGVAGADAASGVEGGLGVEAGAAVTAACGAVDWLTT